MFLLVIYFSIVSFVIQVIVVVSKKPTVEGHIQTRGRRARVPPPPIMEQVFHMVSTV